jgi:isopentenyl-diphosphate delta-isomerase
MIGNKIILVNSKDLVVGEEEKLKAHELGLLHRAVSVFIFNSDGQLLIQQRADGKYHSAGLWANTCCSHPYPKENTKLAAVRRLKEEMGLVEVELEEVFVFNYKVELDHGLTENEVDHVFIGCSDKKPLINKEEVRAYKYCDMAFLKSDVEAKPSLYAEWFKILINKYGKIISRTISE